MVVKPFLTDKKQYFSSLPVSILNIDNSYQKPLSAAHVKKITKDFDPMGVGQIHVSKRSDGTYYVFDGQHRVAAFRKLGFNDIDCIVYEGLTLEEESKGYVYYNNTMKQTRLQKFKAELLAGVPESLDINAVIRSVGLEVDTEGNGAPIKAIGAVRAVYAKYGANDLREVLHILHEAFGTNKKAYQSYVIAGIHSFVATYRDDERYDQEWLINRLKKFGVNDLLAESFKYSRSHGCSKKEGVELATVYFYNWNKSRENKL